MFYYLTIEKKRDKLLTKIGRMRRMKHIERRKKTVRTAFIILLVFLLYIIIGMLLPFWRLKGVEESKKNSFQVSDFYGTEDFIDRAQIIEDSTEALKMRIRMLEEAKERIILTTFDMREGESTKDIIAALIGAADRGVEIKILVDGISGLIRMQNNPLFGALGSYPGIEVRLYNKPNLLLPWTINGRMHDKYIIIDDSMLLIGGRNTFDYFLGDYIEKNKSKDREVFFFSTDADLQNPKLDQINSDSTIAQMEEYFWKIWNQKETKIFCNSQKMAQKQEVKEIKKELKERYQVLQEKWPELFEDEFDYIAYTVPIQKATLIYNPTTIYGKEPWVWYQLKALMMEAEERVYIHSPYAVFSEEMYAGMAEIQEKVKHVAIQINSIANGDNFCASSDYLYHKKDILETKWTIYEYDGGQSSHGKSLLIDDDISVIGSYNFDMRSTYVDTELMFVIHGEEFNQLLEKHILTLEQDCRKVTGIDSYEGEIIKNQKEITIAKKIQMRLAGLIMQLARCLV